MAGTENLENYKHSNIYLDFKGPLAFREKKPPFPFYEGKAAFFVLKEFMKLSIVDNSKKIIVIQLHKESCGSITSHEGKVFFFSEERLAPRGLKPVPSGGQARPAGSVLSLSGLTTKESY